MTKLEQSNASQQPEILPPSDFPTSERQQELVKKYDLSSGSYSVLLIPILAIIGLVPNGNIEAVTVINMVLVTLKAIHHGKGYFDPNKLDKLFPVETVETLVTIERPTLSSLDLSDLERRSMRHQQMIIDFDNDPAQYIMQNPGEVSEHIYTQVLQYMDTVQFTEELKSLIKIAVISFISTFTVDMGVDILTSSQMFVLFYITIGFLYTYWFTKINIHLAKPNITKEFSKHLEKMDSL